MKYSLKQRNFWFVLLADTVLVSLAYYFAYLLRFDGAIPPKYFAGWSQTVIWIAPLKLLTFFYFRLYRGMWRYTSAYDFINLLKACFTSSGIIVLILLVSYQLIGFPRSVFIIDFFLVFLFLGGLRMGIRLYYYHQNGTKGFAFTQYKGGQTKNLLIIGAGDAGQMLVREIGENSRLHYNTIGFIDDDRSKLHQTIHGVPVLGAVDEVGNIVSKNGVDEIIIAIRSATATQMRRIVSACEASGLPSKILPTTCDLLNGKITTGEVREICYEDLLGRESANINVEQIGDYLAGKRIMVTGGVGSIGSELCRQIAQFKPERLVIIDRSESGLYDAEIDFAFNHPEVGIYPILGSVQNKAFMQRVFSVHEPQVVFHAAAYKHVPMMEVNPWEAVFNIIVGSKTILDLSKENRVEMCVIVSTDKAVRPTSVMGASKRVVELMTQAYAAQNNVRFMAVRFGNVLGTAGSVLPLFEKQIERGGPVTVTHPKVTRYFMTIAEACSLILQSGALGKGGEIFVLKMGTPIRIADMACDLIKICGLRPDEDIQIKYTGLRPGEKLHEELITSGEDIEKTEHQDITILNCYNSNCLDEMNGHIEDLIVLAEATDIDGIKRKLQGIVPEYKPWSAKR